MTAERQVTKGKVSEDVGFSPGEAAIHAMRVDIAVEIEKFIKRKKMTLAAAAKFFGVPQDRIRKILKGGYGRLSVEFLIKLVCKTGKIPSITFAEEID